MLYDLAALNLIEIEIRSNEKEENARRYIFSANTRGIKFAWIDAYKNLTKSQVDSKTYEDTKSMSSSMDIRGSDDEDEGQSKPHENQTASSNNEQVELLQKALKEQETVIEDERAERKDLNDKLEDQTRLISSQTREILNMKIELSRLENVTSSLEEENSLTALKESEFATFMEKATKAETDLANQVLNLKSDLEAVKQQEESKILSLKSVMVKMDGELALCQQTADRLEAEKASLQQETMEEIQALQKSAQSAFEELKTRLSESHSILIARDTTIRQLECEKNQKALEVEKLNISDKSANQKCNKLQSELDNCFNNLTACKNFCADQKNTIDATRRDLDAAKSCITELRTSLGSQEKMLTTDNARLQESLQQTKVSLSESIFELKRLKETLEEKTLMVRDFVDRERQHKDYNERRNEEIIRQVRKIQELEKHLHDADKTRSLMERDIAIIRQQSFKEASDLTVRLNSEKTELSLRNQAELRQLNDAHGMEVFEVRSRLMKESESNRSCHEKELHELKHRLETDLVVVQERLNHDKELMKRGLISDMDEYRKRYKEEWAEKRSEYEFRLANERDRFFKDVEVLKKRHDDEVIIWNDKVSKLKIDQDLTIQEFSAKFQKFSKDIDEKKTEIVRKDEEALTNAKLIACFQVVFQELADMVEMPNVDLQNQNSLISVHSKLQDLYVASGQIAEQSEKTKALVKNSQLECLKKEADFQLRAKKYQDMEGLLNSATLILAEKDSRIQEQLAEFEVMKEEISLKEAESKGSEQKFQREMLQLKTEFQEAIESKSKSKLDSTHLHGKLSEAHALREKSDKRVIELLQQLQAAKKDLNWQSLETEQLRGYRREVQKRERDEGSALGDLSIEGITNPVINTEATEHIRKCQELVSLAQQRHQKLKSISMVEFQRKGSSEREATKLMDALSKHGALKEHFEAYLQRTFTHILAELCTLSSVISSKTD